MLYSLVDQRLFGPQPLPGNHDPLSSDFLKAMQQQVTSLPHADRSLWHARFGHFASTGYGAGYYGYLYDRCVRAYVRVLKEKGEGKDDCRGGAEGGSAD